MLSGQLDVREGDFAEIGQVREGETREEALECEDGRAAQALVTDNENAKVWGSARLTPVAPVRTGGDACTPARSLPTLEE